MKFSHYHSTPINEDENPYWVSFSDIMAALLVVFILAAMALMLELMAKKEQIDTEVKELDRVRQELVLEIREELEKHGIHVEITDNKSVISIPEEQLSFAQGKWDISKEYQHSAKLIGEVVYESISKRVDIKTSDKTIRIVGREEILDTVFIEGHTDTVPYRSFNGFQDGNWPLSSLRAISLWEFWNNSILPKQKFEKLGNHKGKKLFSVSGYGGTRELPLTDEEKRLNETLSGKKLELHQRAIHRKNRRIDLRFTVRSPDLSSI